MLETFKYQNVQVRFFLKLLYCNIVMAENKEKLKNFLMRAKEESEKVSLKLNIEKTKIMESSPITSSQIDGETMDYFLGLQNHCG